MPFRSIAGDGFLCDGYRGNHMGEYGIWGDRKDRPCIRPEYCNRPESDGKPTAQKPVDIKSTKGDHQDRPNGTLPETLGRVVQAFKSITTCEYIDGVKRSGWPSFPGKLWQRNYWEHIIRDESEMVRICQYILNNPVQRVLDTLNTGRGYQPTCTVSEPMAEYAQEVWMI
jgi:putative transposase